MIETTTKSFNWYAFPQKLKKGVLIQLLDTITMRQRHGCEFTIEITQSRWLWRGCVIAFQTRSRDLVSRRRAKLFVKAQNFFSKTKDSK